jgi:RNA polymerase sigma-70 factor (ECF subfamily)
VGRLEDRATLKTWICWAPGEQGQAPRTAQRAAITLRDVEGYATKEACSVLDISPGKQRVLLHRARAAVRAPVEDYFAAASFGGLGPVR